MCEDAKKSRDKILFQMSFFFLYSSGEYSIIQEYLVYDHGAFIADVGGYLVLGFTYFLKYDSHAFSIPQGLCLGASLLTFYDLTVQAMVKISRIIRQIKESK